MSIIETSAHNVVKFESGTTKAFTGQRLCTVGYKTVSNKASPFYNIKRESKAVSLPCITDKAVTENIIALVPHIKAMLYKAQDCIVRERLDSGKDVRHITNEEISMSAVLEYLDNSNESGRLTKESVGAWFDNSIADMLMLTLADKLGVSDTPTDTESKQIESIVEGFKDKISALAGGKTSYEPKLCESIKKCLNLAGEDDVMASRFIVRLDKMILDGSKSVSLMDVL